MKRHRHQQHLAGVEEFKECVRPSACHEQTHEGLTQILNGGSRGPIRGSTPNDSLVPFGIEEGPGLRFMAGSGTWYGRHGLCHICGAKRPIPRAVRYWCPDDGWIVDVLCRWCAEDCAKRGPRPGDWAYDKAKQAEDVDAIASAMAGDMDGTVAVMEDFLP